MLGKDETMNIYVFIREGGMFYPIKCRDDASARQQAEMNPGTVRVEDIKGREVWVSPKPH